MKYLYKYPQAAFPYAQLVDENRAARQGRAGVRAARHRRLRRRPLLRRLRRVREGDARGHPDPDHGRQPRPGRGRRCTCCRRSGSATPGRGADGEPRPATARATTGDRHARRARRAGRTARAGSLATARRSCCSPRTRRTRSRLFGMPNAAPYVKDGINDYVVHGATRRGQSRTQTGTKAAAHYRARRFAPGETRDRCGCG